MSANNMRCFSCKGQKQVAGIGGIIKECRVCSGTGSVKAIVETSTLTKPVGSIVPVIIKRKSRVKAKATEPDTEDMFQDTCTLAEVFTSKPIIDPLMQAVLDEPRMAPDQWQAKYKNVPGLFGKDIATGALCEAISKVQRASMRADYAARQPKVKRKIDMTKSQDVGTETL